MLKKLTIDKIKQLTKHLKDGEDWQTRTYFFKRLDEIKEQSVDGELSLAELQDDLKHMIVEIEYLMTYIYNEEFLIK
jgi:hypothetical protein